MAARPVMTIGRVGVWVCSPTKLKKKKNKINRRQSKKSPSLRLRGLINKPKLEQETPQPTAARFKNKPKAEQETAQPTAARFNKVRVKLA